MRTSAACFLILASLASGCGDSNGSRAFEVQEFDVDGATVFTRTALDRVPQQATTVRFDTMLIDDGSGLELCLSGVDQSLPPQCLGPVVEGLQPDGWTETQAGITWGERTVTTTWPPIAGRLQLVEEASYSPPASFEEIGSVIVDYPAAEIEAANDAIISAGLLEPGGPVLGIGSGGAGNWLSVTVAVADRETIDQISDVVDDPAILVVWAVGETISSD